MTYSNLVTMFQDKAFIIIIVSSLGGCFLTGHTPLVFGHTLPSVGYEVWNAVGSGVCGESDVQVCGTWVDHYSGLITRHIL